MGDRGEVDYPKKGCDPYGRNGHHERGMVPLEDGAGGGTAAGGDRTTQRKTSRRRRWTCRRFGGPLREMASVRPFGRGSSGPPPHGSFRRSTVQLVEADPIP